MAAARLALAAGCTMGCTLGCTASPRPPAARTAQAVAGSFLDDGSCQVFVDGVALFAPGDSARSAHVADAAVNLAPAGYELDELACAPASTLATLPPDRAGERALLVTMYVAQGATARTGRYVVRGALASDGNTTGVSARAAAAVFGAPAPDSTGPAGGVRYLEARDGIVVITRLDAQHVVGTFALRALPAWSP